LKKLKKLFTILDLNSGSIDLILEKDTKKYIFLEINPVGQNLNFSIGKVFQNTYTK